MRFLVGKSALLQQPVISCRGLQDESGQESRVVRSKADPAQNINHIFDFGFDQWIVEAAKEDEEEERSFF